MCLEKGNTANNLIQASMTTAVTCEGTKVCISHDLNLACNDIDLFHLLRG